MFGGGNVPADGYAKPHLMESLIEYLQVKYPDNFVYKGAKLSGIT